MEADWTAFLEASEAYGEPRTPRAFGSKAVSSVAAQPFRGVLPADTANPADLDLMAGMESEDALLWFGGLAPDSRDRSTQAGTGAPRARGRIQSEEHCWSSSRQGSAADITYLPMLWPLWTPVRAGLEILWRWACIDG